eukprot:jgi/Mesvir1/14538/Mv26241-RA.1
MTSAVAGGWVSKGQHLCAADAGEGKIFPTACLAHLRTLLTSFGDALPFLLV